MGMIVLQVPIEKDLKEFIFNEAERRGVKRPVVARELMRQGLQGYRELHDSIR